MRQSVRWDKNGIVAAAHVLMSKTVISALY